VSTRRLFFALWPDQAMREALAAATDDALRAVRAVHGLPVPIANLHVTLAFLGSVPEASLARVVDLAQKLSRGEGAERLGETARLGGPGRSEAAARADQSSSEAIVMRLDSIEHWRRAEILCAAASEMPAGAEALSGALKSALAAADFHPDLKPFRAHITLARHVRRAPPGLGMPLVTWSFSEFALIESRTLPEGSSYSIVDSWALGDMAPRPQ
jgi:RNA 2',3'-cyclic 3'-phosphodiesterase